MLHSLDELASTGGQSLLPWIIGAAIVIVLAVALMIFAAMRKRRNAAGAETPADAGGDALGAGGIAASNPGGPANLAGPADPLRTDTPADRAAPDAPGHAGDPTEGR